MPEFTILLCKRLFNAPRKSSNKLMKILKVVEGFQKGFVLFDTIVKLLKLGLRLFLLVADIEVKLSQFLHFLPQLRLI